MAKWGRLAFFYRHPWKSKKKPCLRELYYSLVMSESVQERRIQLPRPRNFTSHQIRISNIKSKLPRKRNSQNPLYVSVFPNFNSQKFWASILIPITNFQILWVSRIPKIPTQTSSQLTSIPKPWNSLDLQDLQHFRINFASVTIAILRFPNSLDLQNFQDLQRKKKKKKKEKKKNLTSIPILIPFPRSANSLDLQNPQNSKFDTFLSGLRALCARANDKLLISAHRETRLKSICSPWLHRRRSI